MTFDEVSRDILRFRDERDWKQFHNPKDLAISVCKLEQNARKYPVGKARGRSSKYTEL